MRLGEQKRGEVSDFAVVSLSAKYSTFPGHPPATFFRPSNQVVTAMRDSEDKLRLMVWEISNTGVPDVIANVSTEGTIKKVSIARVASNRVVTAVRESGDSLRLTVWDISNNGRTITKLGTRTSAKIFDVDIAGEPDFTQDSPYNGRVFTAARNTGGNLFVAEWRVKPNGQILAPTTKVYGPISQIDVKSSEQADYLISVAMRDSEEKLRLISFTESNPGIRRRGGLGTGGKISYVKTSGFSFGGDLFTATISEGPIGIRTGLFGGQRLLVDAGLLKIIWWRHNHPPNTAPVDIDPDRKDEFEVGATDGLAVTADVMNVLNPSNTLDAAIVTVHAGFGSYRKALRNDQGKPRLQLIAWSTWTQELKKTTQATLGGEYTQVEMAPLRPVGESARFVSVMRGIRGELKLVVWALNP